MSNATLKKRRQKKSLKTSSSKLKYKVEPVKVKDDFKWNLLENKRVIGIYEFEEDAKKVADFQNKNQVWSVNGGIPKFFYNK